MLAVRLENGVVSVPTRSRGRGVPEGFALIRLIYGGICNTDLELQRGYYGFRGTPGHEFVGEVVDADDRELDRPARRGRNQSGLRRLRLVRARISAAIARTRQRARNRETSRRVSRISDAAGAKSASRSAQDLRASRPFSSSRSPRLARFWIKCESRAARRVAVLGDGKLGC